jgi:hypothetical protein
MHYKVVDLHLQSFLQINGMQRVWGLPYFVKYLAIISITYQRENVQYFSNKNVITLVRTEKG